MNVLINMNNLALFMELSVPLALFTPVMDEEVVQVTTKMKKSE